MKKFTKTALAIASALTFFGQAHADGYFYDVASIYITGNTDNSAGTEGVFIRSNSGSAAYTYLGTDGVATVGGAYSNLNGSIVTTIAGPITNINATTASINAAVTNIGLNGNAVNIGRSTSINSIAGATNITGALTQVGVTSITGTTSINAAGGANTTIGTFGGASVNTLQGATNNLFAGSNNISATGANTISGATNSLTSTTGGNVISAATSNAISAAAGNVITAGTSNTISAVTSNTISAASNNMTATVANSIQGPVNNIGTDSTSANTIGNTLATTTVTARAGNATQALANGSASTTVATATPAASVLTGATTAPRSQVLLNNTSGTTVDANGKILTPAQVAAGYVSPAAPTAALTLTNGLGNTHGLVVTESQTTLSGGTQSSSMTLNDRAATFSNAQSGAPITVTGVADGRADFDAVNVRQFAGAIAAVAAQANIPALTAGQDRTFGMGVGNFMGKSAMAMGVNIRGNNNAVYKATLSSGLNDGGRKAVVAVGGAWGF
jgi:hypothetical protein